MACLAMVCGCQVWIKSSMCVQMHVVSSTCPLIFWTWPVNNLYNTLLARCNWIYTNNIAKLGYRFNLYIMTICFSMWCLQHAHPWYKKNEIVFNLLLCVRVCSTLFLVFRNLVDITLWSSDQSIAYCEGFVIVLAEHQGHNFQNLIIFISLYKTEENAMLMNLMCISSISILIQRKMN